MSNPVQIDISFALPFDHTLFVEEQLLGAVRTIGFIDYSFCIEDCEIGFGAGTKTAFGFHYRNAAFQSLGRHQRHLGQGQL